MKKALIFLVLFWLLIIFNGCINKKETQTTLVIGTMEYEFYFPMFSSNHEKESDIQNLIGGYRTFTYKKISAKYELDESVVKTLEKIVNADQSKSYIYTLHEDLYWNDGVKITAKDYVFSLLINHNPLLSEAINYRPKNIGPILGSEEYSDKLINSSGTQEYEGVDILGEFKFSITVKKEFFPYYYEFTYFQAFPLPIHKIAPNAEVVQGTKGAKISGLLKNELLEKIEGSGVNQGYRYIMDVSCGPYMLMEKNPDNTQFILKKNPYYKGNYEGQKPAIDNLIIKKTPNFNFDMVKNGELDLITKMNYHHSTINLDDFISQNSNFNYTVYQSSTFRYLAFHCDEPSGVTSSIKVRQAIAYALNQDGFSNTMTNGNSQSLKGHYYIGQWMVNQTKNNEEKVQSRDKDGNLHVLNQYDYSKETAVLLLEEDGWVYNESGQSYVQAADNSSIRYKKVNETYIPLIIKYANAPFDKTAAQLKNYYNQFQSIGIEIEDTTVLNSVYNYYYGALGDGYLLPTKNENGQWIVPEYLKKDSNENIIENDNREYNTFNYTSIYEKGIFNPYPEVSIEHWGYNGGGNFNYINDEDLLEAADAMRKSTNNEDYLFSWQQYQYYYNKLLPSVPLYNEVYYSLYSKDLMAYEVNSEWVWSQAIIYADIEKSKTVIQ